MLGLIHLKAYFSTFLYNVFLPAFKDGYIKTRRVLRRYLVTGGLPEHERVTLTSVPTYDDVTTVRVGRLALWFDDVRESVRGTLQYLSST